MAPRGVEVIVKHEVLKWARESAAVSRAWAANQVGRTPETIAEWESGTSSPSLAAVRELAILYRRPLSVFLLPEPPNEPPAPVDFRLPGDGGRLTRLTHLALRYAVRHQSLASELFEVLGLEVGLEVGSRRSTDDPTEVAATERDRLGVSIENQFSWPDERAALRNWRLAVEQRNVLVMQLSMPWGELRGFSLSAVSPPTIAINSGDYVRARVFTLFHEYGHLLLGTGGLCIPEGTLRRSNAAREAETFCNDFAGSLLVPEAALRGDPAIDELTSGGAPSDRSFNPLVSHFSVSRQVIWQRLYRMGLLSENDYREKWAEWRMPPPSKPTSTGGPTASELCLLRNGSKFVSVVMEGQEHGAITHSDALDYLGIRQRHWDGVATLAGEF